MADDFDDPIFSEAAPADGNRDGAEDRLSEAALADWNREEEDAAWAHLQ